MASNIEKQRQQSGRLYHPARLGDGSAARVHAAQKRFNDSEFWRDRTPLDELRSCFAAAPEDMVLTPPVYFDNGDRTYFGRHFYANAGLTILDTGRVEFGDNVYLGPNVNIYTATHPVYAPVRNADVEYAKPVRIGSDVWIGGNTVVNPGVTIGDNVVIGSGSVVTRDIPSGVIAAGNPCRVLRAIGEADRLYWEQEYAAYLADTGAEA